MISCSILNDVRFDLPDVDFDVLQWARRCVPIEIAVEVDLVAYNAYLSVLGVALGLV